MINELFKRYNFNNFKYIVENSYPYPIAQLYRKCRVSEFSNPDRKQKNIIDLFQLIIQFLSILLFQELKSGNYHEKFIIDPEKLSFLKKPSLGDWLYFLRFLLNIKIDNDKEIFLKEKLYSCLFEKDEEAKYILKSFSNIKNLNFNIKTKFPVLEICNCLISFRNRYIGHGINISSDDIESYNKILEIAIIFLLNKISFIKDLKLIYIEKIEITENGDFNISGIHLYGLNPEPLSFVLSKKLNIKEVYLFLNEKYIKLSPFLLWKMNDETKKFEIYFYNSCLKTRLVYQSCISGNYYFHKNLFKEFKKLLNIELLESTIQDEQINKFSENEKKEYAENLYKEGLIYKQENKFEDALELFEEAFLLVNDIKIIFEIIEVLLHLNESKNTIIKFINEGLQLSPNNQYLLKLKNDLLQTTSKNNFENIKKYEKVKNELTILEHFVPRHFRKNYFLFYLSVITLYFSISASIEFMYHNYKQIFINLFQYILCILSIITPSIGKQLILRLKIPLSIQLDSMSLERFEIWFKNNFKLIFGNFVKKNGKITINYKIFYEKLFLIITIFLIVFAGILGFYQCELYKQNYFFMAKRWFDNIIVVFFISYFIIRYIITTTLFIYNFSKLSLKPMLTKITTNGFRAFSPLIAFNLFIITIAYLSYLFLGILEFTNPKKLDFVFLFIGSILFFFWSLGLPLTLKIAAKEAKKKVSYIYYKKIENSFKTFINDPNQDNLEKYEWFIKNQKVIEKIPTWPMSVHNTVIFVVVSNIIFIVSTFLYIYFRMNYNNIVWHRIIKNILELF